jgi:hypothetical protein
MPGKYIQLINGKDETITMVSQHTWVEVGKDIEGYGGRQPGYEILTIRWTTLMKSWFHFDGQQMDLRQFTFILKIYTYNVF